MGSVRRSVCVIYAPLTWRSRSPCGQYVSRSTRRGSLPSSLRGRGSVRKTIWVGFFIEPISVRHSSMSSAASTVWPARSTTTACGVSPHLGWATPMTAASATAGCLTSAFSISAGQMLKPPGTPEAKAARYRFLSDRAGGKPRGPVVLPARVAVIGAGTMGRGIAQSFLAAGIAATLIDTDRDRVDAGADAIRTSLDDAVGRGRLTADKRDTQAALLTAEVGLAAAAEADLVIEAVFENLAVKQEVFRELDRVAKPGAVLASNTSSLDLDVIASVTARPEAVVGMHFFSPANIMKLVEVVDGAKTSDASLDTALAVARALGKTPVVSQVGPGFIGNRIFDQYLRQAVLALQSGCTPQQVDQALQTWGMAMGPFAVLDLVGNDVAWAARTERGETDAAWAPADALCELGWFGRKTGRGWYDYPAGTPNPDLQLPEGPGLSADEIALRCVLAMVNEAAAVLADGIAATSRDIDTVLTKGYGFPVTRGGPWFFAEQLGWERVVALMRTFASETGDSFWQPNAALGAQS